MIYKNSVVSIPLQIDTFDALAKTSEKIEVILSLILAEIISDNDLYDKVDRIDIRRMSKETDFLSEFAYNYTTPGVIEETMDMYRLTDPLFIDHFLLLREYFYHELEDLLLKQTTDLMIEYIFLNRMTVLISFMLLD